MVSSETFSNLATSRTLKSMASAAETAREQDSQPRAFTTSHYFFCGGVCPGFCCGEPGCGDGDAGPGVGGFPAGDGAGAAPGLFCGWLGWPGGIPGLLGCDGDVGFAMTVSPLDSSIVDGSIERSSTE